MNKKLIGQITRFGIIGILTTMVHVVVAYIAKQTGLSDHVANFCGFLCAATFSFFGNLHFTFRAKDEMREYITRFAIVSGGNYITSAILVQILSVRMGLPFEYSLLAMVVVVPAISFLLQKLWVFRA